MLSTIGVFREKLHQLIYVTKYDSLQSSTRKARGRREKNNRP